MSTRYAELHGHSSFSFLDGASSADDLVERALELGLSALAVTDHQGLYGAVRFSSAAAEAGLHAVIGMEIELLDTAVPDPQNRVLSIKEERGARGALAAVPPGSSLVWGDAGSLARREAVKPPEAAAERMATTRAAGPHSRQYGGIPARPPMERKKLPARRAPKREDLRGIRARELGPHLVLLARDGAGYSSLCRIASAAHLAGTKGVPRFTHDLLAQHTDGLIALTGCRHGEIPRRLLAGDREGAAAAARRLAGLFGSKGPDRAGPSLFIELQHHLLPDDDWLVAELARLAEEVGLPVVVTNDAHYARPEDRELQDVLVGIRHGLSLDESAHLRRPNGEYHLKSETELQALPPGLPDADPRVRRTWQSGIAMAGEVAAHCRVELAFERYRFPGYPVPRGETPFSYLETLCHDGARTRYHPMTSPVVKQLAHELDVIERTGLAEFFLICWDLMQFCRERGIPAQGRGSAGDSVVAYVLGITRVDPIRHRLLFERFINEGRTSYPDVDIDFASSRREEVIQYVYERYGPEHTGMVCNVVTYRARSAVREVGYVLGFPRPLVDRVAKALETYDSVMVRRDLEAEGGFAEFFQASALPQAVAAAAATEASRMAGERAAAMGFIDGMGQLGHGRGGRLATGGAGERGTGRMTRREDDGRVEGGTGAALRAVSRLPDRLAPRTEPRRGPSDDEGGPGDTPVSVRWLRGEAGTRPSTPVNSTLAAATSVEVLREGLTRAEGVEGVGEGLVEGSVDAQVEREDPRVKRESARDRHHRAQEGLSSTAGRGITLPDNSSSEVRAAKNGIRTAKDNGEPTRRIKETSLGALELDPLPPPTPSRSTIGLSPWDRWLELCARIDGFPRHLSIHSGGMLITAAPLVDIAPVERATMPGRVVVQYDKRDVETIKLIKLDLLGLRMLSAIDDALRDISVDCAVHVDLDRLPEDIPEVFRMICAADTVGVFQIESRAQMQTLPKSRPENLDDLVVEVAIIRPGPIQGNAVHPYLRRKQGLEPVTYLHPSLEPILSETLGVILYQEQVMKVAIDVAGFSAAGSDGFRRAMGTWRSNREMEKLHSQFVDGCIERSGLTPEQAEELFRQAAAFASFGFNKSHAAAFARTAYESAFLKLFYPAQFVTGLINAQPMGFYPVEVLINDAKRHGVCILPVDVNRSRYRSTTEWVGLPGEKLPEGAGIDRRPAPVRAPSCVVPRREARDRWAADTARGYGIRLGLHLVKGIGEAEGEALDAELARGGPYRSLADLVARTELAEEIIERLIRAGALDCLGEPRRRLLWQLREVAGATRGRSSGRSVGSRPHGSGLGLKDGSKGGSKGASKKAQGRPLDLRLPPTEAPDLPPPTELERLGDSYAILSLDARRQVVELFRPALDRLGAVPVSRLDERPPGKVAIGGLVVTRQHPMTARGTVFLALEDETGMVNVTLWPDAWARLRGVVRRHALLYVEGTLQRESSVVNLVARRIVPLTDLARAAGGPGTAEGVRQMGQAGMRRLG